MKIVIYLFSAVFLASLTLSAEEGQKKTEPGQTVWPACYDQPCKKSKECCDGTKCLPWMAKMHPKIKETGYCVVKDCKEGDDSTCPKDHTCLKSMMGSYCIKKAK